MEDLHELINGYKNFLISRNLERDSLYRELAEQGQSPKTMVIACCDSRVDPSTVFDASPGQLFVVRNVANLVPSFSSQEDNHGTAAALEFAVKGLNVESILVMGHSHCGGIGFFLNNLDKDPDSMGFVSRWVSILQDAKVEFGSNYKKLNKKDLQRFMEQASVKQSLKNLRTFPFIQEREELGLLKLRGAYFDIFDGKLLSFDPSSGSFNALD